MDEIYEQNAKIVYFFLYSLCRDEALAEDLMQETFLKAIQSLDTYNGQCKLSTWLCQIAKHLLYQHWEKSARQDLIELDENLPLQAPDTGEKVLKKLALDAVMERIRTMPEQMRKVVLLRAMSDLSYREIGQMLGRSENWARVTFYRAKEILIKEGYHEQG